METTTPELQTTPTPKPGPKNTFLLVICILTFIGSGFGVLGAVFSFGTANTMAAINQNNEERMADRPTPDFFKSIFHSMAQYSDPAKIKEMALLSLLSNLLTLAGALMMLKLKMPGFYLYIAGILIYIIIPIMFLGGYLGLASAMFYGLIGAAFIVMYAVNLKYMNR
ncbi:MAG TPA: hypothetical protein VK808_12510 [Bacteroidia bacterium]|jgi:hypothetical protein|nr:hypothetical protein [Bacteroidia bacterium]